jgi:hypothetical protein
MWLAAARCSWVMEVAVVVVGPQERANEVRWVQPHDGLQSP